MAEHVWTVLCYKYLTDPDTNIISLIDVADQLILHPLQSAETVEETLARVHAAGKKGVFFPVNMLFITFWVRSEWETPEEAKIRITFAGPQGEKLLEQEQEVKLLDVAASRISLRLDSLRITTLGVYWFIVERESEGQWERMARLPLEIRAGN